MSPRKSQHIVGLVQTLAAIGLAIVVMTTAMVGWTLARIRNERVLVTMEQKRLDQASEGLREVVKQNRIQAQTELDESIAPTNQPSAVRNMDEAVRSLLPAQPDPAVLPTLNLLREEATRLAALDARIREWRTNYNEIYEDNRQLKTMTRARELLTQLRGTVDMIQGAQRLKNALQYRRWREAGGEEANRQAAEILHQEGAQQSHDATEFSIQLAELAGLVERLGGEQQIDNLVSLKDNNFIPVFSRMNHTVNSIGAKTGAANSFSPQIVEKLQAAIFGEDCRIDEAHQTIQEGRGGLFALRRKTLSLQREQRKIKDESSALFQEIDAANAGFAQCNRVRTFALTQLMEDGLTNAWQQLLVFGGLSLGLFLWLAWLIIRGIKGQVHALNQARADAENGRQMSQKLMLEQQAAAAKLAEAQRELLDVSRKAGMAQVATGVLHNVGNVLNSVNVSITHVQDKLRGSEIASLVKLGALLEQRNGNLSEFLTTDPKGKVVPGFVIQLAGELQREHEMLLKEHEQLARNVDHIKEIVSMQQNYAKVSGFVERISLSNLVEDALLMNTAGLGRHGVEVVREFAEVPSIMADKHKVLQILVNLVHNAKYALDMASADDRQLKVSIASSGGGSVKVVVSDNGIGIPPENLTRIFSHGFTTRKNGHGFGLHSGALAAREMGGSLKAESPGPGRGATFTLELPLADERSKS